MRIAAIAAGLILVVAVTTVMVRAGAESPAIVLPPPDGPQDHTPGPNWLHQAPQRLR